jgi:hypothetical protein
MKMLEKTSIVTIPKIIKLILSLGICISLSGCKFLNKIQPTSHMLYPRYIHSALLLKNGNVLILGGIKVNLIGSSQPQFLEKRVEIYDVRLNRFIARPAIELPTDQDQMWNHWNAILLQDETVLITGGYQRRRKVTTNSYLYDYKTGKTITVGKMITPRIFHSSILLKNGKVLLAGGLKLSTLYSAKSEYLKSAEIFDPKLRKFLPTGYTHFTRSGGQYFNSVFMLPEGKVILFDGEEETKLSPKMENFIETYDPSTGHFDLVGKIDKFGTMTQLKDGNILITNTNRSAAIYHYKANKLTELKPMSVEHGPASLTTLKNGDVLIMGGTTDQGFVPHNQTSVEIFDYKNHNFYTLFGTSTDRGDAVKTLLNDGRVLITGGHIGSPTDNAELFIP